MILQESAASTALNQDRWPRSRLHPHSSNSRHVPHPGQFGDQRPHSFCFLEVSMQATLASPQCKLEPFGSAVSGAQAQAGTVHPQWNLDDAIQGEVHRTVQAQSFSRRLAPHPAWLTGSRCQEGDSGAGQGRSTPRAHKHCYRTLEPADS